MHAMRRAAVGSRFAQRLTHSGSRHHVLFTSTGQPSFLFSSPPHNRWYSTSVPPPPTNDTTSNTPIQINNQANSENAAATASNQAFEAKQSSTTPSAAIQDQINELEDSLNSLSDNTFEQAEGVMDTVLQYVSPARYLEDLLTAMHDNLDMSWWATIAASAFIARVLMTQLSINTIKFGSAKAARMMEERKMITKIQKATDLDERLLYSNQLKEMKKKYGTEEWRMLYTFAQFPILVTFLYTLRSMAQTIPSMTEGGLFWFTDLSLMDTTFILPVMNAALQLIIFEIGNLRRFQPPGQATSTVTHVVRWFVRGLTIASIMFTKNFPAAIFLYWIPSNLYQIILTFVSKTDWFKKRYNIVDPTSFLHGTTTDALRKQAEDKARSTAKQFLPAFLFKRLYPDRIQSAKTFTQEELTQMRKNK